MTAGHDMCPSKTKNSTAMVAVQYRVPALLAVGLEGFWGLVICSAALPILSKVHGSDGLPLDGFNDAIKVHHRLPMAPCNPSLPASQMNAMAHAPCNPNVHGNDEQTWTFLEVHALAQNWGYRTFTFFVGLMPCQCQCLKCLQEIAGSKVLQWSTLGSIASIAFFNFFGISVTKQLSGAGRATIDACRTVFVWMFSLWIGWERFHGLQASMHMTAGCFTLQRL